MKFDRNQPPFYDGRNLDQIIARIQENPKKVPYGSGKTRNYKGKISTIPLSALARRTIFQCF